MNFQYLLSPEVWTMVFHIVSEQSQHWPPSPDIKNVRLTCRRFEELATPFLMSRFLCTGLSNRLAMLTAVSLHPVFSRTVQEIVYVCTSYRLIKNLPEYESYLRIINYGYEEPESVQQRVDLANGLLQYCRHYNDQHAMETSGEVIARLCSALMRMPKIEKCTISPNFCLLLDGDSDSNYFLRRGIAYDESIILIARALSLSGTTVRELNIENNRADFADSRLSMPWAGLPYVPDISLSHCYNVFRSLRKITIGDVRDIDAWAPDDFNKILLSATDLESLSIGYGGTNLSMSPCSFLDTMECLNLNSLNLSENVFDQEKLLALLQRFSVTLKDLSLSFIQLPNRSWEILLEGIKSSLSLQTISIHNIEEDDGNGRSIYVEIQAAALKQYILYDGPFPLLERNPVDLFQGTQA